MNQIPGLPALVTYVRTLISGKVEMNGTGNVRRSLKLWTSNGVNPIQALPSNSSGATPGGRTAEGASAVTGQGRNASRSQLWPMTQGRVGSGEVRWSRSRSPAGCRSELE